MTQPTIGIIGAGKVGETLARLWYQAGYTIHAIYSRTEAHAQTLSKLTNANCVVSPIEVIRQSDLTLLTLPDDVIEPMAISLAQGIQRDEGIGKGVIHTSGTHSVGVLKSLEDKGLMVGSLHPAFPFADVETAMQHVQGATFALETNSGFLRNWLNGLVKTLNGQVIVIPEGYKSLYHVALVIASNYTVTLYAMAEQLLIDLGADKSVADHALNALVGATIENIRLRGVPEALTGPLVRADVGTLDSHLKALSEKDSALQSIYVQLARLSYPMLIARGINTQLIEEIFDRD